MPRLRPSTSFRILGVVTAVVLALLLAIRVQARMTRQQLEEQTGPLTPDAYASATVADEHNAVIWWRAAAAALALDKAGTRLVGDLSMLPVADWTPEQREGLERVVTQAAPALALAERAATLQGSSWDLSGEQATGPRPDIPMQQLLWLARLVNVRARLAVDTGDWAAFRLSVAELGGLAASLERETPLISVLVGLAVERMAADAVLTAVRSPTTPREALEDLSTALPPVDLTSAWRRSMGALATGAERGTLRFADVFGDVVASVTGRDEQIDVILEALRRARRPLASDTALIDEIASRKDAEHDVAMADMLAEALLRLQSIQSLRRLERLAVDLRIEGLATGRYPETLAGRPEASEADPFTGGTMDYELHPDGSATVEVPGAEEAYNRASALRTFVPYTWELPVPGAKAG